MLVQNIACGVSKVEPSRGMTAGFKTGGRTKGTPNKATAEIKALAMQYTEAAMKELGRIAVKGTSEAARVAAIKEIFDRGYGRAIQSISSDQDNPQKIEIS